MKNLSLPQHINLLRLSEHTADFRGSLLIKDMQRLRSSLYSEEGVVMVDLGLGVDAEGTQFCRVQLKTEVILQCQRCMEPVVYGIISDFLHGVVNSEQEAEKLSEQYEPVLTQEGMLVVQDMVEDELILRLPIVPVHATTECKMVLPVIDSEWNKMEGKKKSPFHVLEALKQEPSDSG